MNFSLTRRLTWGEADPAGLMFTPRALHIAIESIEALWVKALGHGFYEWGQRGHGAPYVTVNVDFARPIIAGMTFKVVVQIEAIGGSSLAYRVIASDGDGELFRARLVSVLTSTKTMRPVKVPEEMRAKLEPYSITIA